MVYSWTTDFGADLSEFVGERAFHATGDILECAPEAPFEVPLAVLFSGGFLVLLNDFFCFFLAIFFLPVVLGSSAKQKNAGYHKVLCQILIEILMANA